MPVDLRAAVLVSSLRVSLSSGPWRRAEIRLAHREVRVEPNDEAVAATRAVIEKAIKGRWKR